MGAEQIVTLTGDDAALFKAYQRIIDQQIKMEKGLDRVADKAKKAKEAVKPLEASDFSEANATLDEFGNLASLGGDKMSKMMASVGSTVVSLGSAAALMQAMIGHQERINALAQEQLDVSNALAKNQAEAIKNMAVFGMQDTKDILTNDLPDIAKKTGFSDIGRLTQAATEAISIVPKEQAIDALTVAAETNTLTPESVAPFASGLADLMMNTQVPNANEVYGLVASLLPNARPSDTVQFMKNLSKSSAAANATKGEGFDPKEASREAGAAFAFLTTQTTDLTGDSSSSNLANLMSYTQSMFGDSGREDREKRLIELGPQLRSEKDAAKRKLIQQEIDDLKALNAATLNDPGSFVTRRQAIMDNPVLLRQFERNVTGEAIYKPVFKKMFTRGSEEARRFEETLSETQYDSNAVEKFKQKRAVTPQMRIGQLSSQAEAEKQAMQLYDPTLEVMGQATRIRDEALQQTATLPNTMSGWAKDLLNPVVRPVGDMLLGKNPDWVVKQAGNELEMRIYDAKRAASREEANSESFKTQIQYLEKMVQLLKELKSELKSVPPPPPANPGTINNQFKAGKGM